nr:hypothetical protein [Tanacetum cinerariifolium]
MGNLVVLHYTFYKPTYIPLRPNLRVLQIGIKSQVFSSDEASSTVPYTSISSDYEEPSDVGSPEVVVYGYDILPMHPPYAAADLPKALSLGYIADSDLEEDLEDGSTNYPADGGYDDDDDSSRDEADEKDVEEASEEDEDEEEEEHLAPDDSTTDASLDVDPVPSAKETEPFETDESATTPPPAYCTTARMSI